MRPAHGLLYALLTAALPVAAQDAPITFKGIAMGATQAEYRDNFPHQQCAATTCFYHRDMCIQASRNGGHVPDADAARACRNRYSFGGVTPRAVNATFRDGRLVQVYFQISPRDFDAFTAAARGRIGAPSSTSEPLLRTPGGAPLENRIEMWIRDGFLLAARRYSSSGESGSIMFSTPDELARRGGELGNQAKDGAKDF